MSFRRLLDDLARERDQRASAREAATLVERVYLGGRAHRRAMAGLAGELQVMTKAMTAAVVRAKATDKESAFQRLAEISQKGNEMAAAGKLSGEEGAFIDIAIAHMADRIRGL